MILTFCLVTMVVSAGLAAFLKQTRKAVFSLWICGLSSGGLFLVFGAELLAIVQWILSTLVALSFLFYSLMFGDEAEIPDARPKRAIWVNLILGVGLALLLSLVVIVGWREFDGAQFLGITQPIPLSGESDLYHLGLELITKHLLSVEVLGLTLFLVMIGYGSIALQSKDDQP